MIQWQTNKQDCRCDSIGSENKWDHEGRKGRLTQKGQDPLMRGERYYYNCIAH